MKLANGKTVWEMLSHQHSPFDVPFGTVNLSQLKLPIYIQTCSAKAECF
jgi:hypothetical protein